MEIKYRVYDVTRTHVHVWVCHRQPGEVWIMQYTLTFRKKA